MTGITESRFNMWRAVVAMAHADGVVTAHELDFINNYIRQINLSTQQLDQLAEDLQTPQDVYECYAHIKDPQDKVDFFALARALSWCDGDFDGQERMIIERLEKLKHDQEGHDLLQESREILNEIELDQDQWKSKTERGQGLFDFLKGLKEAV